nr:uncharacterized protein LOC109162330 [Ipomoea batatas]
MMASMLSVFVWSLLFIFSVSPACSTAAHGLRPPNNQTFRSGYEARKMRMVRAHLNTINKPAVKTIQSPDGDTIDCVLTHKQPAFDHPLLKGSARTSKRAQLLGPRIRRFSGLEAVWRIMPRRNNPYKKNK